MLKKVNFRGMQVAISDLRLKFNNPNDLMWYGYKYVYMLRHGDGEWDYPITLEEKVVANRCGYMLTETPINLGTEVVATSTYINLLLSKISCILYT